MKYFDEMFDKNGFDDGNAEPIEARRSREMYVLAVNTIATALKAKHRLIAYNRPGTHNSCMILVVPVKDLEGLKMRDILLGGFFPSPDVASLTLETSHKLKEAIEIAHRCDMDQYVTVKVEINTTPLEITQNVLHDIDPEKYPPIPWEGRFTFPADRWEEFVNDIIALIGEKHRKEFSISEGGYITYGAPNSILEIRISRYMEQIEVSYTTTGKKIADLLQDRWS